MVPKGSPAASDTEKYWLRKPGKRAIRQAKGLGAEITYAAGRRGLHAAETVVGGLAATGAEKLVEKVSPTVGAVAATVAGASAAQLAGILLAGALAYLGTSWLIQTPDTTPLERVATAYRKARTDLAQKLGRELTPAEQKALSNEYKRQKQIIMSQPFGAFGGA